MKSCRVCLFPAQADTGQRRSCDACEPGRSQPEAGHSACVDCSVGLFAAASGATACDACAAGTYATDDADDADNAGVAAGAVACAACAAGTYAPKNGSVLCYTCDVDAGQWSARGATDCEACLAGFFLDGDACRSTVEALTLRDGYWRSSETSTKTEVCAQAKDCAGGRAGGGDALCAGNTRGPACALCERGYAAHGSSDGDTLGCARCEGTSATTLRASLAASIGVALLLAAAAYRHRRAVLDACYRVHVFVNALFVQTKGSRAGIADIDVQTRGFFGAVWNKVRSKLKIVLTLAQLLSDMDFALDVKYPPVYGRIMHSVGRVTHVSLAHIFPLQRGAASPRRRPRFRRGKRHSIGAT